MASDDFNWLVEHGVELAKKYAGKWIAVSGGAVVGVGDTAPEVAAQAREKVGDGRYILEAIDDSADVIYFNGLF